MTSTLAAQLAQNASLNRDFLVDRSKRRSTESYLFTGNSADQYDLDSIYSLACNGLLQLASINNELAVFESTLFSQASKHTDRTLLTKEGNQLLDKSIAKLLRHLGPYLLETPTGKVLEWLVRRYRIHEFNLEDVLRTFLPYHESPHFAKMISILHIKPNSKWSFLLPFKSAAQSLPRPALVAEMVKNHDVALFVIKLLPEVIHSNVTLHRSLMAFNVACLHDFLTHAKLPDEGLVAALLPSLLDPLKDASTPKDALLGSYILLSALSHKCDLSALAVKTVISAMVTSASRVATKQFLSAAIAFCEPQPTIESLPESTIHTFLSLKAMGSEICASFGWVGSVKLLQPMIPYLVSHIDDARSRNLLSAVAMEAKAPRALLVLMVSQLLQALLNSPTLQIEREMLSDIRNRHPDILQEAKDMLGDSQDDEEVNQVTLDQVVLSLSVITVSEPSANDDVVIASMDADDAIRTAALKKLLQDYTSASDTEKSSISSALIARLHDSSPAVIEVLYSANPSVLVSTVLADPAAYVQNLSIALSSPSKPKRSIIRLHLSFLLGHISGSLSPELRREAFYSCIYPFLLFSKPRQHTAESVWELLSELSTEKGDILSGLSQIWAEHKTAKGDDHSKMVTLNERLVQKLADNIVTSNDYNDHLKSVLQAISTESDGHAKILSPLLSKAAILRLSGAHRVEAALAILNAYPSHDPVDVEWTKYDLESEVLDDSSLGKIIISKPNSSATREFLRISLLNCVASIAPPASLTLDWITDAPAGSDTRGRQYVSLMKKLYGLANKFHNRTVTTLLLRTLFSTLSDETLAFLAGLWSTSDVDISDFLRSTALDYARAFLQAHLPQDTPVDFQTIVPSLLVALQSHSQQVREAAIKSLQVVHQLTEKKFTSDSTVYGFDVVYGTTDRELQYLDHGDLKRYLSLLVSHAEHLLHDHTYLHTIHLQHLLTAKEDKKKEAEFKHHTRCYLFSHINAFFVPSAQTSLLKSLDGVSDPERASILAPTIDTLLDDKSREQLSELYGSSFEEFAGLLFNSFDESTASELNADDSQLWDIMEQSVLVFLQPNALGSPFDALFRQLESGLFARFSARRKIQFVEVMLNTGVQVAHAYSRCRSLLLKVLQEVSVIIPVLQGLQPNKIDGSPAPKKPKLASPSPPSILSCLVLLSEVLASAKLPPSLDLISNLLETLSNVSQHASPAEVDLHFLEQLLMTAIGNIAAQVTDVPNLTPSAIRIDVLVEVIRVSDNPQTFQQALLLTSALAHLAPESVLRNIMPVFTFMGSNVFHRDDAYSFRVIQQTIENIIPVMAQSLRESSPDRLTLYIGARDLLRVFVDAYTHIPRHRRTSLFVQLTDVLGASDFLAPTCMLLVEKVSSRITRQSEEEVHNSLALPLAVLRQYPGSLQLLTLIEVLKEAQRLAVRLIDSQNTEPHLLDWSTDEDRSPAVNVLLRKRCESLLIFVGLAAKTPKLSAEDDTGPIQEFISLFISLSTMSSPANVTLGEVASIAQAALGHALGAMSAKAFLECTVAILDSDEPQLQLGAMLLMKERIPMVSDHVRKGSLPQILRMIQAVQRFIGSHSEESTASTALQALSALASTMKPDEESALTNTIPLVINIVKKKNNNLGSALVALKSLSATLGPRLIPHLRDIVKESSRVSTELPQHTKVCLEILMNVLNTIPSFCGQKELGQIILLYVVHSGMKGDASAAYITLAKTLTKRVAAAAMLSALSDTWDSIGADPIHVAGYFGLLKRTLRNAPNDTVVENTRQTFDVFVRGFDRLKDWTNTKTAESEIFSAFLQLAVKLNDTAFRPLFRQLYDWAFVNKTSTKACQIVFCSLYYNLVDYFKVLMNPYMRFLYQPFLELLGDDAATSNPSLWAAVIRVLTITLRCENEDDDDDALAGHPTISFWRDDKLAGLLPPLIAQVPLIVSFPHRTPVDSEEEEEEDRDRDRDRDRETDDSLRRGQLSAVLLAVAERASPSSDVLKQLNLTLLMHTRSPSAAVRQYALEVADVLWQKQGGKLLGYVHDSATFIVEAAEDDSDQVVNAALKLKESIETLAGKLDLS